MFSGHGQAQHIINFIYTLIYFTSNENKLHTIISRGWFWYSRAQYYLPIDALILNMSLLWLMPWCVSLFIIYYTANVFFFKFTFVCHIWNCLLNLSLLRCDILESKTETITQNSCRNLHNRQQIPQQQREKTTNTNEQQHPDPIFPSDNVCNLYLCCLLTSGKSGIDAICDSFEVRDLSGNSRFKVTEKGVTYGVDEVTYSG